MKIFFSASLYSRTRITSKTVPHIMENNFALRYVFKHPGVNSRAELVPSHGASRRRLGENGKIGKCPGFEDSEVGMSEECLPVLGLFLEPIQPTRTSHTGRR